MKKETEVYQNVTKLTEATQLMNRMTSTMESQIAKVKATKHGRVTKIFQKRDIVAGSRKTSSEAEAIEDPESGELIVSNKEQIESFLNTA